MYKSSHRANQNVRTSVLHGDKGNTLASKLIRLKRKSSIRGIVRSSVAELNKSGIPAEDKVYKINETRQQKFDRAVGLLRTIVKVGDENTAANFLAAGADIESFNQLYSAFKDKYKSYNISAAFFNVLWNNFKAQYKDLLPGLTSPIATNYPHKQVLIHPTVNLPAIKDYPVVLPKPVYPRRSDIPTGVRITDAERVADDIRQNIEINEILKRRDPHLGNYPPVYDEESEVRTAVDPYRAFEEIKRDETLPPAIENIEKEVAKRQVAVIEEQFRRKSRLDELVSLLKQGTWAAGKTAVMRKNVARQLSYPPGADSREIAREEEIDKEERRVNESREEAGRERGAIGLLPQLEVLLVKLRTKPSSITEEDAKLLQLGFYHDFTVKQIIEGWASSDQAKNDMIRLLANDIYELHGSEDLSPPPKDEFIKEEEKSLILRSNDLNQVYEELKNKPETISTGALDVLVYEGISGSDDAAISEWDRGDIDKNELINRIIRAKEIIDTELAKATPHSPISQTSSRSPTPQTSPRFPPPSASPPAEETPPQPTEEVIRDKTKVAGAENLTAAQASNLIRDLSVLDLSKAPAEYSDHMVDRISASLQIPVANVEAFLSDNSSKEILMGDLNEYYKKLTELEAQPESSPSSVPTTSSLQILMDIYSERNIPDAGYKDYTKNSGAKGSLSKIYDYITDIDIWKGFQSDDDIKVVQDKFERTFPDPSSQTTSKLKYDKINYLLNAASVYGLKDFELRNIKSVAEMNSKDLKAANKDLALTNAAFAMARRQTAQASQETSGSGVVSRKKQSSRVRRTKAKPTFKYISFDPR
jgi:hypothetical protein